jgi:hypothetical protein
MNERGGIDIYIKKNVVDLEGEKKGSVSSSVSF